MEELYELIEEKIKASGYPRPVDGEAFYDEVSREADGREEGAYIFMVKWDEDLYYEGHMEVLEEQFDLHTIDIHDGDTVYHVDFDA